MAMRMTMSIITVADGRIISTISSTIDSFGILNFRSVSAGLLRQANKQR